MSTDKIRTGFLLGAVLSLSDIALISLRRAKQMKQVDGDVELLLEDAIDAVRIFNQHMRQKVEQEDEREGR